MAILAAPLLAVEGEGRGRGQGGPRGSQFQGGGGRGPGGPGRGMQGGPRGKGDVMSGIPVLRMLRTLKLTEKQQAQVKTITEKAQGQLKENQKAVMTANMNLHKAVIAEAAPERIRNAANAIGKAMGDEAVTKVAVVKEVKALLTPEQLEKLKDVQKKMAERMQQMQRG